MLLENKLARIVINFGRIKNKNLSTAFDGCKHVSSFPLYKIFSSVSMFYVLKQFGNFSSLPVNRAVYICRGFFASFGESYTRYGYEVLGTT
jgi:hypothetical protein